jgi:hypothetical protein
MSARFAGSQRVGERRRRRLAVEADEGSLGSALDSPNSIRRDEVRQLDDPHMDPPASLRATVFPSCASRLVPFEWWKYLLAAMGLSAIAAGLLVAGSRGAELSPVLGPGFERLFGFPSAPATRWLSGALLFVSAELALFIWWARSQSQNDYEGRYWMWIRVASAWLVFSVCLGCGMHEVLRDTVLHFRPDFSEQMLLLSWLAPATAPGALIFAALIREMGACRWSRGLFLLAAGAYACSAGLCFEFDSLLAPDGRRLAIQGALMAGHIGLLFSMWCHARHVIYCTADPAIRPKSNWRIPRPHFSLIRLRLPQFRRHEVKAVQDDEVDRAKRRGKRPARNTAPEPLPVETTEDRTAERQTKGVLGKSAMAVDPGSRNSSVESERIPQDAADRVPRQSAGPAAGTREEPPRDLSATQRRSAPIQAAPPAAENSREAEAERDESLEQPSKPDLRGLSKKQRRRLLQELRERERAMGRQ